MSVQGHLELVSLSKDIHSTLGSKRKHFFIASGAVSCFHTQGWHKEMCTFQGLLNLGSNYIGHFFPPGCRDSDGRRRIRAFARHWFKYALEKVCLVAVSATRARCGSMERVCVVMIIVDEVWGLCSPGWQWQAVFFVPNVHWHGRRSPLL